MSIDKQRVSAVTVLEQLGYSWTGTAWAAPEQSQNDALALAGDRMHGLLMDRAAALAGCLEDSEQEAELEAIGGALVEYENLRWPSGRVEPPHR